MNDKKQENDEKLCKLDSRANPLTYILTTTNIVFFFISNLKKKKKIIKIYSIQIQRFEEYKKGKFKKKQVKEQ